MINTVTLFGRMTSDAEMRASGTGLAVAKFSLAVNERKRNHEEITHFIDCTAFGKVAEIARDYLGKGQPVIIQGRLNQESWETKDGLKKTKLGVVVENLQLLPKQNSASQNQGNAPKTEKKNAQQKKSIPNTSDFEEEPGNMPF